MSATIRIEGAEELIKKLNSIEKLNRVKSAIKQAGQLMKGYLQEYPTASHRPNWMLRGNSERAARMRRGFFAKLKAGEIDVPYRRGQSAGSEKLGQSWTVRTDSQGFRALIGTGVSYARMVQDSARQTGYHRQTGWITTNQAVRLHGGEVTNLIETALRREVESG